MSDFHSAKAREDEAFTANGPQGAYLRDVGGKDPLRVHGRMRRVFSLRRERLRRIIATYRAANWPLCFAVSSAYVNRQAHSQSDGGSG